MQRKTNEHHITMDNNLTSILTSQSMNQIVEECYNLYREDVRKYITYKLGDAILAQDLTQDVFLRLMECGQLIRRETMRNMVYTISRNIVTDYLRRYYRRQEMEEYFIESTPVSSTHEESSISAQDIAEKERARMKLLPPQRQKIYEMVRFEEKSVPEIAQDLQLSTRTVENHLAISRKEIRAYIRECIG